MKTINNILLGCLAMLAPAIPSVASAEQIYATGCEVPARGKWAYFYTGAYGTTPLTSRVTFTPADPAAAGYRVDYTYDEAGRRQSMLLTSGADGTGASATYTYNADGLPATTDERFIGGGPAGEPLHRITRYEYDAQGQVVKITVTEDTGSGARTVETREYEYAPGNKARTETITTWPAEGAEPQVSTIRYVPTGPAAVPIAYRYRGKSTDLAHLEEVSNIPQRFEYLCGNLRIAEGNLGKITAFSYLPDVAVDTEVVFPDLFFPADESLMSKTEQRRIIAGVSVVHESDRFKYVPEEIGVYTLNNEPVWAWDEPDVRPELYKPYMSVYSYTEGGEPDWENIEIFTVYTPVGKMRLTYSTEMPVVSVGSLEAERGETFGAVCDGGILTLTGVAPGDEVVITDMAGRRVARFVYTGTPADLGALAKGVYIAASHGRGARFMR